MSKPFNQVPAHIKPGLRLNLKAFGPAVVTKVYMHETKEMVCDVKADSGHNLHLSFAYVSRVFV